jgi:uncharacterized protein
MATPIETRSILGQLTNDHNRLVGYASVFDTPTVVTEGGRTFTEIVRPGAFRKSIESKGDILVCFNHDGNRLLGRTASGTARVHEDAHGLRFEVDLPEAEAGLRELVQRGDVRGASFSFAVRKGGEHWDGNTRELRDLFLYECGPVVAPAYAATSVGLRGKDFYRRKLKLFEKSTHGTR